MKALLLLLAIIPMFSRVKGGSESMSCSTVNGKMVCERQKSDGNMAFSSSQAGTGFGQRDYQNAFAGTADSGTGAYSASQTSSGNPPGGYNVGGFSSGFSADYDYSDAQPPSGGFGFAGAGAGAGAGAFPFSFGPGFVYPQQAPPVPPANPAPPVTAGFAGAGAGAGAFPFFFGPGFVYPPQAPPAPPVATAAPPQANVPYNPAGFNPFAFVNGFMGGGFGPFGPGAAAGAFAGGFPFGRR